MGENERLELSARDLSKIAKLMSKDINENIDMHLGEAVAAHSIALRSEFKEIFKGHESEVCAVMDSQNIMISQLRSDQIQLRNEMDAFKEAYPIMGMYINVTKKIRISFRKTLTWIIIGVLLLCGLFKLTH